MVVIDTDDTKRNFEEISLSVKQGLLENIPQANENNTKLALYALYKIATVEVEDESSNLSLLKPNISRPGMFDPVGQAKWDVWNNMVDTLEKNNTKGQNTLSTIQDFSREKYIALVKKLQRSQR